MACDCNMLLLCLGDDFRSDGQQGRALGGWEVEHVWRWCMQGSREAEEPPCRHALPPTHLPSNTPGWICVLPQLQKGPSQIRTGVTGFRVQGDNHYTIEPAHSRQPGGVPEQPTGWSHGIVGGGGRGAGGGGRGAGGAGGRGAGGARLNDGRTSLLQVSRPQPRRLHLPATKCASPRSTAYTAISSADTLEGQSGAVETGAGAAAAREFWTAGGIEDHMWADGTHSHGLRVQLNRMCVC
jgi:hypothetical protein